MWLAVMERTDACLPHVSIRLLPIASTSNSDTEEARQEHE